MVKRVTKKQRGKVKRKVKKMIVAGLEGKNVTEAQYLNHFNSISRNYRIVFSKGNSTNPFGIVEDTIKTIQNMDFDFELGDRAYCLIDTDYGKIREKQLIEAIDLAKRNNIDVLLTNPTFEVWFLLHFKYSTKKYINNEEVIVELRKYIPDYKKNRDIFDRINSFMDTALLNANKLEKYHDTNYSMEFMDRCPSSKVYELLELVLSDD